MPTDGEGEKEPLSTCERVALAAALELVGERLGPGGGLALAPLEPFLETLAGNVKAELRATAERRQLQTLATAAEAIGQDPEGFTEMVGQSDHSVLITAQAMAGAAGTAWPHKVYALGRALADGLIAEENEVNVADLVIPAMTDMDRPHVNMLDLLVAWQPVLIEPVRWGARPYLKPAVPADGPRIGRHRWTYAEIADVRPALEPVLTSLLGTLQRHGLAAQNDNLPQAILNYSRANEEDARRRAVRSGGRPDAPVVPRRLTTSQVLRSIAPEESWSPTPLGEKVLGYYRLAATEFETVLAPAQEGGQR